MAMLEEDVIDVIRWQKLELERKGMKADAVYLGREDWNELRSNSRMFHCSTLSIPGKEPEVLGLRIWLVDTKLHVRVVGNAA